MRGRLICPSGQARAKTILSIEFEGEQRVIKAVIFDVDGTLVDSNELHVQAWIDAFWYFGKDVSYEELCEQMGKGSDQLMPVFCSKEELDKFGSELAEYRVEIFTGGYLHKVRPFPKVRELFERIKADGLQIALASSAKEEELEQHKKNLKIADLLEAATSADDAERSKPHPDIFQAALDSLDGVEPEEAVVIGDSPFDIEAAGRAGIRTIAVLSGGFAEERLREAGATEVYADVAELLERYDNSMLARERALVAER
jgi:HAD superfamily hydrolase (TIGR01509 family)